ncbi:MAG: hypothetical protein HY826_12475 [Actinobacteria bacterium]|nr:hypothetical protein [Actinomycetota bacterium]
MTEIPEHLLKRSKERRGESGAAATTGAAVATTQTAAAVAATAPAGKAARTESAAPAGPPPTKPDTAVVVAYKARKKIPAWAMVTLSILPVWAFMYVRALQPVTAQAQGPLGEGAAVFASCSSCHGAAGEGIGTAYAFKDGAVMATFPHIEDQLRWVKYGTEAYVAAGVEIYGDPNREGGARIAGASGGVMPAAAAALGLTDVEILAVVCHERYTLAGGDVTGVEYEKWCGETSEIFLALEAGTATFANVHEQFEGVLQIGEAPLAGTAADV